MNDQKWGQMHAEVLVASRAAAQWYDLHWDSLKPRECLRQLELLPEIFAFDHNTTVRNVINDRKWQLAKLKMLSESPKLVGRMLVYEPSLNLADCLAEGETNGLFDSFDCPPWGLWVGYINNASSNYILSWIPEQLITLTQSAIEVTCGDSLYWLDQCNEPWAKVFYNPKVD